MTIRLRGLPGAPGIAVGPVWQWTEAGAAGSAGAPGEAGAAAVSIDDAAARAATQLAELADRMRGLGRPSEADIFDAQALMATDEALLGEARRRAAEGERPASAVTASAEAVAAMLAALDDETLSARAADVRDVGARIVRVLSGRSLVLPSTPSIAAAEDLPPSVAAEIPDGLLLGIALEGGSPTAHAVILARSLGIPAVVGIAGLRRALDGGGDDPGPAGAIPPTATIDGSTGEIVIGPDADDLARIEARRDAATTRAARARELRGRPGATADGVHVALLANVGRPADIERALAAGAEGIGLFRTEFLFMGRDRPPSEAEQVAVYRQAFEAFGRDHPVVVRLADIGGDKDIPYLDLPAEQNPFLGVRAIRLASAHRDLLLEQLRAIWRAGSLAGVVPHVMAPMVGTLADVETLVGLRDEARSTVAAAGDAVIERIVTGIMVELPAACVLAPELARRVDFFSVGTNDLTQYLFAADRGNAALAAYQDALHPAVLRSIAAVVAAADAAGIPAAVCGELAGDPAGALVLAGIGVDELSMDPGSLDAARLALASVTWPALRELGAAALRATDAKAVRDLVAGLPAGA